MHESIRIVGGHCFHLTYLQNGADFAVMHLHNIVCIYMCTRTVCHNSGLLLTLLKCSKMVARWGATFAFSSPFTMKYLSISLRDRTRRQLLNLSLPLHQVGILHEYWEKERPCVYAYIPCANSAKQGALNDTQLLCHLLWVP